MRMKFIDDKDMHEEIHMKRKLAGVYRYSLTCMERFRNEILAKSEYI
jgi:hypothetical protein